MKVGDRVVCIEPYSYHLTFGEHYKIIELRGWHEIQEIIVKNDLGVDCGYDVSQFMLLKEERKLKLNKLYENTSLT